MPIKRTHPKKIQLYSKFLLTFHVFKFNLTGVYAICNMNIIEYCQQTFVSLNIYSLVIMTIFIYIYNNINQTNTINMYFKNKIYVHRFYCYTQKKHLHSHPAKLQMYFKCIVAYTSNTIIFFFLSVQIKIYFLHICTILLFSIFTQFFFKFIITIHLQ